MKNTPGAFDALEGAYSALVKVLADHDREVEYGGAVYTNREELVKAINGLAWLAAVEWLVALPDAV